MKDTVHFLLAAVCFTGLLFPLNVNAIQCHSCSGKGDCETIITLYPDRSGRCQIDKGTGKCFIRKDPNNVIYWGCIDDAFWPGVPWRTINGCLTDWDRAWEQDGVRNPMIWCFCDRDDCNTSIQKVNSTNWDELDRQDTSTRQPITTGAARQDTTHQPSTTGPATTTITAKTTTVMMVMTTMTSPMTSQMTQAITAAEPEPRYRQQVLMQATQEISTVTSRDVLDPCPHEFILNPTATYCYKVVSPTETTRGLSRDYSGASRECNSFNANLVNIDSTEKQLFLASILEKQTKILDGWQGWWTNGQFSSGVNQFSWPPLNKYLALNSKLWGFLHAPYRNTCVWVLSMPVYEYTLANYDCNTKAGFICEIEVTSTN